MHCTNCQRDTAPIQVDGEFYCISCSNLYHPAEPRRAMDLVAKPSSSGGSAPPLPAAPTPAPQARTANDLHARPRAAAVIDLRVPEPATPEPPKPTAKPSATLNRYERRQLNSAPGSAVHERHSAKFTDRFERARSVGRSAQISRFDTNSHTNLPDPAATTNAPTLTARADPITAPPPAPPARTAAPAPQRELPQLTATQHAAMTRLTNPSSPATPAKPATVANRHAPSLNLSANAGRIAATGAAVAIMAGYIWFHNYPKLTIQNAGARAGITASLPSYLPSSYTLGNTQTKAGAVSLSFNSPSAATPLTITQTASSWDPNSLLDNYVAKTTDDYDAVAGQGLTIYLFGQNTATWVNHGIWYSIAGASQLSRDQVLKIAYSL